MKPTLENFEEYFKENFYFTCYGPNLWRAYNRSTNQSASPVYNSKEAAMYYVQRELMQEIEDNIHEMLGGDLEYLRDKHAHD